MLTEFVYVLDKVYGIAREDINAMVSDFIAMPGVEIIHEIDMAALLRLWPEKIVDYGDAIIVLVAKGTAGSEVVTFDRGLRATSKGVKSIVAVCCKKAYSARRLDNEFYT